MDPLEKGVVVIGGHVQGLGIVRIFGKNGIPSIVFDANRVNLAKHSKYTVKFVQVPQTSDIPGFLIEIGNKFKLKDWLLIPTDDDFVRFGHEGGSGGW